MLRAPARRCWLGPAAGPLARLPNALAPQIGTIKNPTSHREIEYDDPAEAAEVVLLADLLMRILDRVPDQDAPP